MDGCGVRSITDSLKSSMTHSQESRVSSTQDNYRLSEESRSSVSALVSRLNSSAHGVDATENKKLRGDLAKTKEKNMQDPFPWMRGFCNLCQAFVGTRNAKHLENLMNIYLENVTPNVEDCYRKPNRAAKLKKSMNTTLIFFHLLYQEVKEALEHSFYLDKMTTLVSMYLDMELKASIRSTESSKKVASRLTSSLYIFLDNSEEHMLDAILMTKYIHKNYREICQPLLMKLINNISMYPIYDKLYVRYLLTFKLWKKIIPDPDEKKRINRTAVQKLHEPPNLMKNIKGMGNVLPRIPKTKKEITLFLMQSNFNLKNACKEFLKYVKTSQKAAYSQVLGGVEIDKPLFFMNHSGDTSPRLTEKEDENDSGSSNNLMNDIWSAISTVESNVTKTKRSKEMSSDKATAVASPEVPVKKKKMKKKVNKGKKKMVVCSEMKNKKKKKCLKKSELTGILKEGKKLSKLKKKKKKLHQTDECSQVNVKQAMPQNSECNQLKRKMAVSQTEECLAIMVKPASSVVEEFNQVQSKQVLPLIQECDQGNGKAETPTIEECTELKVEKSSSEVEEPKEGMNKQALPQTVDCDQSSTNQTSLQTEENDHGKFDLVCNQRNSRQVFVQLTESDQVLRREAKIQQIDFPKPEKFDVETPPIEECSTLKVEKSSPQAEESKEDMLQQTLSHTVECDQSNVNQTSLQTEQYDDAKFNLVCNQINSRLVFVQVTESDQVLRREAKIQQIDFPKSEKFDVSDSITKQNSETEIPDQVEKVKTEFIMNINDLEMNSDPEIMKHENTISYVSCGNVSDLTEYKKSNPMTDESGYYKVPMSGKSDHKNKVENIFEVPRSDIFTVEKEVENMDVSVSSVWEEEKVADYSHKIKNSDALTPVLDSSDDMDLCASSVNQVVCDQNVGDASKADPYIENLAENKPRETKEDTHMSDDGDSITRPFSSKNGEEFIDYFCSEKCHMNRNDKMELESEYPIYELENWNCIMPDRLIMPVNLMEEDDDDEIVEIQESNMPTSLESTPRRGGLGKISFDERKEEEIKGRNASHTYLLHNSSDSGSATTDISVVTPSASGSSSPRSESAMESIEIQETIEPCDSIMKGSEPDLMIQNPDKSYNSSSSPKSSYTVSSEKERFSDCLNRKASVVLSNMDNYKFFKKDTGSLPTLETPTASRKNCAETLRTKTPNQLVTGCKIDTQNASGKQRDGKYFMTQSKAVRGQRRRGRPPCRGKAVSSSSKLSSDTKSIRKQGNSGKGRTDPEYQMPRSKKSLQNDRPMTRSLVKGLGMTAMMVFDNL